MSTIRITTGDRHLDNLLSPDQPEHAGIEYELKEDTHREAPVVLILGAAGTGKTALSLQIADATAAQKTACSVFLYSLEQSKESLEFAVKNFGLPVLADEQRFVDFEDIADDRYSTKAGCIYLCHFSPLPLSTRESQAAFEDRFLQLSHMIAKLKQDTESGAASVFIIDSLNAIATSAPERSDIYRLFSVFRSQRIPLVITAERQELATSATTSVSEAARFLADVVIELTKDSSAGHLLQYLEISKSRVQRQSLGRHLYKIRTVREGREKGGIQVYRSMPYVISTIRPEGPRHESEEYVLHGATDADHDLSLLYPKPATKAGHCFALLGPPGTHKLAVALNLAGGYRKIAPVPIRKLLIISFGGVTATNLEEIAWFNERGFWRCCPPLVVGRQSEKCWWATSENATVAPDDGSPPPSVDQLTFRLGHLTPEECFDYIADGTEKPKFSAVVLSDTAEISTGFPLLRRDPLFIPALIELFHNRGLTSVCIGVQSENTQNREMDFALQSCADCRLYFTHYPSAYDLAKEATGNSADQGSKLEQSVSVIADIVAGRVYSRHPHWLWIDSKPPTLHCGTYGEYQAREDRRIAPPA